MPDLSCTHQWSSRDLTTAGAENPRDGGAKARAKVFGEVGAPVPLPMVGGNNPIAAATSTTCETRKQTSSGPALSRQERRPYNATHRPAWKNLTLTPSVESLSSIDLSERNWTAVLAQIGHLGSR